MFGKAFLLVLTLATGALAHADVVGQRTDFRSPGGVAESCVALTHIPGGQYSSKDTESEQKFCAIDFYANDVAMCAKTWSTSPGTMIYSTDGVSQSQYEEQRCAGKAGHTKIAKFKNTMNAQTTSSTFSTSSLMYYHFSRYFESTLDVPVAVYRSIDKDQHFARVSSRAQGIGKMNQAAWGLMRDAEQNPATYVPTDELFTADRKQIYGIMLKDKGEGYGAELEGTEADPWGVGQNNDFQATPGFLALRSAQPLAQAIAEGTSQAIQDPIMHKAVGDSLNPVQVAYWMKEISEITLLDYIFSQQDRIMNIDYTWEWVYADASGKVQSAKVKDARFEKLPRTSMAKIPVPSEIAAYKPILIQHSAINDNDAGGRVQYTNFTKKTQMLEKIRHYSAGTYRKLVALNKDFQSHGALYQYSATTFGLTQKQLGQLTSNTQAALGILKATCLAGQMRFDIEPKAFVSGQVTEAHVECENP